MDILIKNMEMPRCCGRCPCYHAETPIYCQASKGIKVKTPYAFVADGCPLVEVPPHGRLIDADRLPVSTLIHHQANGVEIETLELKLIYLKHLQNAPTVLEANK